MSGLSTVKNGLDPVPVFPFGEQVAHAAQIAQALLADIADRTGCRRSVRTVAASSARMKASSTARLRVSSPTPGANSFVPSRRTVTSVPAGNTVSRCAATTINRPVAGAAAHAHHVADRIDLHVRQPVRAQHLQIGFARASSPNGGAGICVSVTMSPTVRSCSRSQRLAQLRVGGTRHDGGNRLRRVGHRRYFHTLRATRRKFSPRMPRISASL